LGLGDAPSGIGAPLAAAAPGRPPICLFTPYFKAGTAERQQELDECLQRNAACEDIDRIVLLVDDGHVPPVASDKIHIVACAARPTYRQWLELTAPLPADALSILANTDIHFDDTLGRLQHAFREPETFMALSRYDRIDGQLVPHEAPHWSQDTWAVRAGSPILPSLMRLLDVPLGVPRCDNKVAYLFAIHGWKLVNPIRFVHSVHLHQTQQRNYDKKADLTVMGGVAYVHPGPRVDSAAAIDIDVWALGTRAVKSVAVNNSLDKWRAQAAGQAFVGSTLSAALGASSAPAGSAPTPAPAASSPPTAATSATQAAAPSRPPAPQPVKGRPGSAPPRLPTNPPALVSLKPAGELVYEHARRFRIFRDGAGWSLRDTLRPHWSARMQADASPLRADGALSLHGAAAFIEPVLDTYPISVAERPAHASDVHFWQYPAATERQALHNHQGLTAGGHLDASAGVIHTYLGLPWATYIDKKHYPPEVATWIKPRLAGLRALAQQAGLQLAVHTVCQQIHWRRFVEHFRAIGVTDLHLSHCEQGAQAELGADAGLRLHSWPLIAVNVEDEARRIGLDFNRPVAQRRHLASFIGAHMPHYRSDVRLRLLQAARDSGRSDVLVDLGSEWHFNKIVYVEQVASKAIAEADRQAHDAGTLRYNQVLSDSVFSLCPEGAGPNTLRVWESIAVGAIPVIMADHWVLPAARAGEPSLADCSVVWPAGELKGLFDKLAAMSPAERQRLSDAARACYQAARQRFCFA
jgi:hypothetical protein